MTKIPSPIQVLVPIPQSAYVAKPNMTWQKRMKLHKMTHMAAVPKTKMTVMTTEHMVTYGAYIDEPVADEEWLQQSNIGKRRKKIKKYQELQLRWEGNKPVPSW